MCQRCLAAELLGEVVPRDGTPIAPFIGTAVHNYIDQQTSGMHDVLRETKVFVGDAGRYGPISGSVDHFNARLGHVIDYKIMGRKKIGSLLTCWGLASDGAVVVDDTMPASSTFLQYYHQMMLYGRGLEQAGHTVNRASLFLIPRDATIHTLESDTHELDFAYREEVALDVLERAAAIFDWARNNPNNLDDLPSDPHCYDCRRRPSNA